jgi:hypothetical protein
MACIKFLLFGSQININTNLNLEQFRWSVFYLCVQKNVCVYEQNPNFSRGQWRRSGGRSFFQPDDDKRAELKLRKPADATMARNALAAG